MAANQHIGAFTNASATDSDIMTCDAFGRCESLEIACVTALTGVNTLQSNSMKDGSGVWVTVQYPPGTDVTLVTLKSVVLPAVPFMALRIHTTIQEVGTRVFEVNGKVAG